MDTVRLDKWLSAARFFKTRSLAARACELGRIQCNKQPAKPARNVRVSEFLQIDTEGGQFELEVLLLSEIRGPASIAHTLYRETEPVARRDSGLLKNVARACFQVLLPRTDPPSVIGAGSDSSGDNDRNRAPGACEVRFRVDRLTRVRWEIGELLP